MKMRSSTPRRAFAAFALLMASVAIGPSTGISASSIPVAAEEVGPCPQVYAMMESAAREAEEALAANDTIGYVKAFLAYSQALNWYRLLECPEDMPLPPFPQAPWAG